MSEYTEDYRGLWWEWLAARIVFALGFGIPIIAILVVAFLYPAGMAPTGQTTAASAGVEFCQATISVAQSYGIVPNFAKASGQPQRLALLQSLQRDARRRQRDLSAAEPAVGTRPLPAICAAARYRVAI